MASLYLRSSGYYYLLSLVNGRRIWKSTGCKKKSEALQTVVLLTPFCQSFGQISKMFFYKWFERKQINLATPQANQPKIQPAMAR